MCKSNFKHLKAEHFLNDVQNIDGDQRLKIDKKLVDKSFDRFFQYIRTPFTHTCTSKKALQLQCGTKTYIKTMDD